MASHESMTTYMDEGWRALCQVASEGLDEENRMFGAEKFFVRPVPLLPHVTSSEVHVSTEWLPSQTPTHDPYFAEPDPLFLSATAVVPPGSAADITNYLALLAPNVRIVEATAGNLRRVLGIRRSEDRVPAGTAEEAQRIAPAGATQVDGEICSRGEMVMTDGMPGVALLPRGALSEGPPTVASPSVRRETGGEGEGLEAQRSEGRDGGARWASAEPNYFCWEPDGAPPSHPMTTPLTSPPCQHQNLVPILGALRAPEAVYLVHPQACTDLESVLRLCPEALEESGVRKLVLLQILKGLEFCHSRGLTAGGLAPRQVLLSKDMWVWLDHLHPRQLSSCRYWGKEDLPGGNPRFAKDSNPAREPESPHPSAYCTESACAESACDYAALLHEWLTWRLTNFEYLLALNELAGRRPGDPGYHTVMPWVTDMTGNRPEDGWRDLRKTKWRLAKGDEQLDHTYALSEPRHHIPHEILSEVGLCTYKARRLSQSTLTRVVRAVFEPKEYPASLQRLYEWTPDECIPEFYTDVEIFVSKHGGMDDLALPSWRLPSKQQGTVGPQDFIRMHREALESRHVSENLHHWIDLTFGFQLSGRAAIDAKNVALPAAEPKALRTHGRPQLFTSPHPQRPPPPPLPAGVGSPTPPRLGECSRRSSSDSGSSDSWGGGGVDREWEGGDVADGGEDTCPHSSSLEEIEALRRFLDSCRHLSACYSPPKDRGGAKNDGFAGDLFGFGCIAARLYLGEPLISSQVAACGGATWHIEDNLLRLPSSVRPLVAAAVQPQPATCLTPSSLLASSFFPPHLHQAHLLLSLLPRPSDTATRPPGTLLEALQSLPPDAALLCAPSILSCVERGGTGGDVLLALLKALPREGVVRVFLPRVREQLEEPTSLLATILAPAVWRQLAACLGYRAYFSDLHPHLLRLVTLVPSHPVAEVAGRAITEISIEAGAAICLHQTLYPLLSGLEKEISTFGVQALVKLGTHFWEPLGRQHVAPTVRDLLRLRGMDAWGPQRGGHIGAMSHALTIADGLIDTLDKRHVAIEFLEAPNNVLVDLLEDPRLPAPLTEHVVRTLLRACHVAGPDATCRIVVPATVSFFSARIPPPESSLGCPPLHPVGSVCGGGLELLCLLYSSLAKLIGRRALRAAMGASWEEVEEALGVGREEESEVGSATWRPESQHPCSASLSLDATSLLLDEIGWSQPRNQRHLAQTATSAPHAARNQPQNSPRRERRSSSVVRWQVGVGEEGGGGCLSGGRQGVGSICEGGGSGWLVKYSWQAHAASLHDADVAEQEDLVVTAGTRGGETEWGGVRCWQLPTGRCMLEYTGHRQVAFSVRMLPGGRRAASLDGSAHIWDTCTGERVSVIAEADAPTTSLPPHPQAPLPAPRLGLVGRVGLLGSPGRQTSQVAAKGQGQLYRCQHVIEWEERLVLGTDQGQLRFVSLTEGRPESIWQCGATSAVTAVSAALPASSPLAIGFASGQAALLDPPAGTLVVRWNAHQGAITKLAPHGSYQLVSTSHDRTLALWDIRRGRPELMERFEGSKVGPTSFATWDNGVIIATGNKLASASFGGDTSSEGAHADRVKFSPMVHATTREVVKSSIWTMRMLPLSRMVMVCTQDGRVHVCD